MKVTSKKSVNTIAYKNYKEDYNKLAEKVLLELNSTGYVVIKNFEERTNLEETKAKFLELSKIIGTPIGHDVNNKIIWDIKYNSTSNSFIKTYSEHSHEAELHTDSQYSKYPEDYFNLLTLKKANCGGGISYILKLEDILKDLRGLKKGKEIESILRETNYPFIVPNVFKKDKSNKPSFNFGPILRDNEIRFRIDTFEKAIKLKPNLVTEEQITAYNELKTIILNNSETESFYLEEGDLIFINNKTTLHGRSLFTDEKRHLLRIRLNKIPHN
ncbi:MULTISPECIES: TauD/TfdA family dioxygenase [Tenacibaculum]|uniref:TauD/TfdA family dioxygenase n=1 Tax=Tenacibaculum TaxID=104267 RepID=UPI001F0AEC51|nr:MULTISPECIES: TauD/TfdA family dioxygenase [Tenacibaculum]MCH3881557.1 TauD/TfdA family dioxygenase [Tenacibaculum aquimarinum]MDO6598848.1 TauD/TfdA family dioxygenase [Tenacibaculum sp. 1_MG-2023]